MKSDLDHVLFISAYLLCLVDALIFGYSTFGALPYAEELSLMLRGCAAVLVFIKLVLDRHYPLGLLISLVGIGLVLLVTYVKSGYSHILYWLLICLGVRYVDEQTVISLDFWVRGVICILIVFCGLTGVIENYVTYRTNSAILRYSIGYNHPNTVASIVLSLILEEAWLHRRHATGFYTVVIWIIAAITYLITSNRTAVLIMLVFPVALFFVRETEEPCPTHRIDGLLHAGTFSFASVFSYVAMTNARSSPLFRNLDLALSNRFYNANVIFKAYGVPLLGQHVALVSVKTARLTNSSIALLDVAYLRLLIQAGPVVLALLAWLYGKLFYRSWKNRDQLLILILLVFILFGFCESGFNNVFMNFTALMAAKELFCSENKV